MNQNSKFYKIKKGQVIFKSNLTYEAPHVGTCSNHFWNELML